MPYCSNCRTFIPDGVDTCPNCGMKDTRYTTIPSPNQSQNQSNIPKPKKSFFQLLKRIVGIHDKTYEFDSSDIAVNTNNAVLAYLGPFVIIPFIIARKSKFAMFHSCQGLMNTIFALLYLTVIPMVFNLIPDVLAVILLIPYLLFLAVFPISLILGIVSAAKGKAVTLPFFGRINLMRVLFKNL